MLSKAIPSPLLNSLAKVSSKFVEGGVEGRVERGRDGS
jgi:hypothetical protein